MMKLICDNYEKEIVRRKAALNKQKNKSPSPTKSISSPSKFRLLVDKDSHIGGSPCKLNAAAYEHKKNVDLKESMMMCNNDDDLTLKPKKELKSPDLKVYVAP
eukprot:CAMPEP_0116873954 /NCGR_PEP_ID=MMETSP0463-20121206/5307_1 /TAXON_ID=181622 /ORGANISM="Strombidinopsis sp, Strain SopsisLIS2011" /LENGTH=102 /DNA_ID=CAMNT_0004516897 /DNA_START=1793 /DNA_END=2101 /DNA_ORIENTATION=+